MTPKPSRVGLAAAAFLIAGASFAAAQSGGSNERLPGGVEHAPDASDAATSSSSIKPPTGPRVGVTRGLVSPKAVAPPAPATGASPAPPQPPSPTNSAPAR